MVQQHAREGFIPRKVMILCQKINSIAKDSLTMAGHSQFANIKHRKDAQDKKKAKVFTKLGRELIVAARLGPDPNTNARLRAAMIAARSENMPKDRIESAVRKGAGLDADATQYDDMRYEGYGPGGVAIIVEVLTDNKNRSASDVRSILTKHGGNLGESGSVSFMFERLGEVQYKLEKASADAMLEAAIEVGADNCETIGDFHSITCAIENLSIVRDGLIQKFGDPASAALRWKPKMKTPVNDKEVAEALIELIETLEDHDDVQIVTANYDISESVMQTIAAAS
jgi:YebC/PmpR family DNA-binding regulatory protein